MVQNAAGQIFSGKKGIPQGMWTTWEWSITIPVHNDTMEDRLTCGLNLSILIFE